MKKLLPPTYFLASLSVQFFLHFCIPIFQYASLPFNLVGIVPLGIGVHLNLSADRLFKAGKTTVLPFEESTRLVEEFPFSVTRNPMYLGMSLILLGAALLLGTVGALIPVALFPIMMNRVFIRDEERMLSATFGEDWDRYRSSVRRWL